MIWEKWGERRIREERDILGDWREGDDRLGDLRNGEGQKLEREKKIEKIFFNYKGQDHTSTKHEIILQFTM